MTYPTSSSASDVWSLRDVYKAEAGDEWPEFVSASDPNFADVSLLINADGLADGSTAFVDESNNNHTITANGNAQTDTTVFKYGSGSMQFDGSGDYLSVAYDLSLAVEGSNFTIEFWYYPTTFASATIIYTTRLSSNSANRYEGWSIATQTNGTVTPYLSSNNSSWDIASGPSIGSPTLNAWNHIAIVRNGNNWTGYLNGTGTLFSTSSSSVYNASRNHIIGGDTNGSYVTGYLDDFRLTKGVARYTADFTPPASAFLTR